MKPDYNLCDICKKPSKHTIAFYLDRVCDAAGSMEDVYEYKDLCEQHLALQFQKLVNKLGRTEILDEFYKEIKLNVKNL